MTVLTFNMPALLIVSSIVFVAVVARCLWLSNRMAATNSTQLILHRVHHRAARRVCLDAAAFSLLVMALMLAVQIVAGGSGSLARYADVFGTWTGATLDGAILTEGSVPLLGELLVGFIATGGCFLLGTWVVTTGSARHDWVRVLARPGLASESRRRVIQRLARCTPDGLRRSWTDPFWEVALRHAADPLRAARDTEPERLTAVVERAGSGGKHTLSDSKHIAVFGPGSYAWLIVVLALTLATPLAALLLKVGLFPIPVSL